MPIDLTTNPLRKGLQRERAVEPCVFVIFGGAGDLARHKLLPALYHLHLANLLPRGFAIVSYASAEMSADQYRETVRRSISAAAPHAPKTGKPWDTFGGLLHYVRRSDDVASSTANLKRELRDINDEASAQGNFLFYMAVPPFVVVDSVNALGDVGLNRDESGRGWRRIVVEKPFGSDLASACDLNRSLHRVFAENQIYRIDHYLGKEAVQNILVFRFANEIAEPLLNSEYVDHIQITMAETIGVEERGGFYDGTGALRDVVQNHLLQILALICMNQPSSLDSEAVRDAKTDLLRSVRKIDPTDVDHFAARGQYAAGKLMGQDVPAYRQEADVSPESATETYVALKFFVDNPRWSGVPIYVRTGKRLAKRAAEVAIQLKRHAHPLFAGADFEPNVLALNIQPDEGIMIRLQARTPGLASRIQPVRMDFRYTSAFGASVPDAYERLLLDAMVGDPSLYTRADQVEAAWEICDPFLEGWRAMNSPVHFYLPGSWGPAEAAALMRRDGRDWRRL